MPINEQVTDKTMRADNRSTDRNQKSCKRFIYLAYGDNYFNFMIAKVINKLVAKYPQEEHIIYPLYGARIYSDATSRYNKRLKRLHLLIRYLGEEWKFQKKTIKKLMRNIDKEHKKKLRIVGFNKYLYHLCLASTEDNHFCSRELATTGFENAAINGVKVGDLVIDTYLRYKGVAKFDPADPFCRDTYWRARAIESLFRKVAMNKEAENYLFGAYGVYIQHGIPLRLVCSSKRGTGITFGKIERRYLIHSNLENNIQPTHNGYHHKYTKKEAEALPKQVIGKARSSITNRAKNIYDNSMSYMKERNQTSYTFNEDLEHLSSGILMMLHDFFDAPHGYQWMLFTDYMSWTVETADYCIRNGLHLYIKPHPNQLVENEIVIGGLKAKLKSEYIHWIPKEAKNSRLFDKRPRLVTTANGSVVAEAAWNRLPVLVAGDHPGANFKIATVPKTKEEYFLYLLNEPIISKECQEEAILFTAIHHRNTFDEAVQESIPDKIGVTLPEIQRDEGLLFTDKSCGHAEKIVDELLFDLFEK